MQRLVILCMVAMLCVAMPIPGVHAVADPVQSAIAWLHTQQHADGSFGTSSSGSAGLTADLVYALARAGQNPAGAAWSINGHSALDALEKLAPAYAARDAGQAGKVARAVALAGGNPRSFAGLDLVGVINAAYDPATGRYHPNLLFRHIMAIEGLLSAGQSVPPAAFDAVLDAQLPDGGWFWAFEGVEGDVDTTGKVLQILGTYPTTECARSLSRAESFLAAAQLPAGGWGVKTLTGPANADSTALVVAGLRAIGSDPDGARFQKQGKSALESLLGFQEPSGAFVYIREAGREEFRIVATTEAAAALTEPLRGAITCTALPTYLPVFLMPR